MLGSWIGTYSYSSKRLPEEFRKRVTKFRLTIDKFDGRVFSGTVEDDPETGGMKGIGKITGEVKNDTVKFTKEIPVLSVYEKDGAIYEDNRPHRKIYYSGNVSKNEVKGTWKIKFGVGKVGNRGAVFSGSKGTWKMKKEELM